MDPRIAEEHEVVFDGVRELCHRVLHNMAEGGWLASGLDPGIETTRLHALVDGLAVHSLMGRLDEERILIVLDSHLSRIILDP